MSTASHEPVPHDLTALTLEDVPALTDLVNLIDVHEGFGEPAEEPSIREWLTMPDLDLATDSVAVREDGRLIAIGLLDVGASLDRDGRVRCQLMGGVHPEHRRRGLGTAVLDRLETRAAALAAQRHPGSPAVLRCSGGRDPEGEAEPRGGVDVRPVLDRRGYTRARSWFEMRRELRGEAGEGLTEVAGADLPGVVLRSPSAADREPTRLAHIAAFADHWGSAPIPADRWAGWWDGHTSRHEHSSIAVDADGTVLAYVLTQEDRPGHLHVGLVGTRPEARGRGLARAVLARSLASGRAAGYEEAQLEVDTESLTGATRLYEAVGFTQAHVYATYEKPVATA